MYRKSHFFCTLLLCVLNNVATPTAASREQDMEILLQKPFWTDVVKFHPKSGFVDDGREYKVGDLVAKDSDGRIVNRANLEVKIRQYYTLLSCYYSDCLQVIVEFLYIIAQYQYQIDEDLKEAHDVILGFVKDYDQVFVLMKSSLNMLSEWYTSADETNKPIENNHIVRAIDSLRRLTVESHNVFEFITQIISITSLLDEFQEDYLRLEKLRSKEDVTKILTGIVERIADSENSIAKKIDNLKFRFETSKNYCLQQFEEFGFEYNSLFGTVRVKKESRGAIKSIFNLIYGLISYF